MVGNDAWPWSRADTANWPGIFHGASPSDDNGHKDRGSPHDIIIGSIMSVESIAPVVVTSVRYKKRLTVVQVVEDMRC